MACRLVAPSHYLNQCWNFVNWTPRNKVQWYSNRNPYVFIQENPFQNVVWKIMVILSRSQFVKADIKENVKASHYRPFMIGKSSVTAGFSPQKANNEESDCALVGIISNHFDEISYAFRVLVFVPCLYTTGKHYGISFISTIFCIFVECAGCFCTWNTFLRADITFGGVNLHLTSKVQKQLCLYFCQLDFG